MAGDDFTVLGRSGTGNGNDRDVMLMQWTVQNGLLPKIVGRKFMV